MSTLTDAAVTSMSTSSSHTRTTTSTTTVSTTTPKLDKQWYTQGDVQITKAEVDAVMRQTYVKPKNVIVMIADGMGPNDIIITEKYSEECFGFGLLLNQFKNHGKAITNNDNGGVTDSAASATALATGVKTSNEKVGMTRDGIVLKNVSEIAREQGKKVGIVTNDQITGATPSGYTVHAHSRESTDILANSFVDFAPDVLIGQNFANFIINLDAERQDKFKNNFLTATTIPLMATVLDRDLTGEKPLIGFFNSDLLGDANNMLAQCTEIALNRLDNEKGFFLMIEGAGTDKAGHQNDIFAKMSNVITFERAIAVVLKFMKNNPDTLLLITSDHECGGVQLPAKGEELTDALFTSTSHTSKNVRVFALGYGTEYFRGKTVDNTDIGKFTISAVKGELS